LPDIADIGNIFAVVTDIAGNIPAIYGKQKNPRGLRPLTE